MKSFSQFITEKKEEFFINSKGERVPLSQATRQDVGMAPKDLENVTPDVDDVKTNKVNKNKISKKTSGSGKIVFKPKPGEKTASNLILKQQTPGTNVTVKGSNTYVNPNKSRITTDLNTRLSSTGRTIKDLNRELGTNQLLDRINNPEVTTSGTVKNTVTGNKVKTNKPSVTTNVSSPKKFKSFLDRILVSTGVKPDPKYKSKFTTPTSKVTVGGKDGTNKVLSQVSKKALRSKIFKGLGRFAGGAFAVKDALDKARDERRLGRSKISQILGGLAKGAGGYLGGALGATLGTLGGGGIGSFALGTGGAITGYNLGSRAGEYLYNKGRELATGETKLKLPGKKTFKKFKDDVTNKVKGLDLRNLGRNKKDQK